MGLFNFCEIELHETYELGFGQSKAEVESQGSRIDIYVSPKVPDGGSDVRRW